MRMRLIDADALVEIMGLENAVKWGNKDGYQQDHSYGTLMRYEIKDEIDAQPTVEAVPVVHGKWIMKDSGLWQDCSVCGVAVEVDSMYMCKASEDMNFNYCPHCGAKMEGDDGFN